MGLDLEDPSDLKEGDFEVTTSKPHFPGDNEATPYCWRSLLVWEKAFILLGFCIACIVAGVQRSNNTIGLGYTDFLYRIQHSTPIFDDTSSAAASGFRRFPALTLCSNEINSTNCPTAFQPCTPDPSSITLGQCRIYRYDATSLTYSEEECPDWRNIPTVAVASAQRRYCIVVNAAQSDTLRWRAKHANDRLRLFLRLNNEHESSLTPWYGGFGYLHQAGQLRTPSQIFQADTSNFIFGPGGFYRLSFDLKRDLPDDGTLKQFKECSNEPDNAYYEIAYLETQPLAPGNQTADPETARVNISSLSTVSVGFHGRNPSLVCSFHQTLNDYSTILEHLAGLLVIPELGAMFVIWCYLVCYKCVWRFCKEGGGNSSTARTALCCSMIYAVIAFFAMVTVLCVGLIPL